jgi:hypothetical protein
MKTHSVFSVLLWALLAGTAHAADTSVALATLRDFKLVGDLSGAPQIYGADARPAKLEWMIRQAKSFAGK